MTVTFGRHVFDAPVLSLGFLFWTAPSNRVRCGCVCFSGHLCLASASSQHITLRRRCFSTAPAHLLYQQKHMCPQTSPASLQPNSCALRVRFHSEEEGFLQERSGAPLHPRPTSAGQVLLQRMTWSRVLRMHVQRRAGAAEGSLCIAVFAVAGTLISTLVFGLLTYFLVIIHVVQRSALGPAPLTECMLYGADASSPQRVCPALLTENGRCIEMIAYIHLIKR